MARTSDGPLWPPSSPPAAGPEWRWDLQHVRELPGVRADLRRRLTAATGAGTAAEDASERIVQAFDEMASNALRHGGGRVTATLAPMDGHWLVEVWDAAADRGPSPAVGRDPSQGGLGLYLIAELAVDHGWRRLGAASKSVWAVLPGATTG